MGNLILNCYYMSSKLSPKYRCIIIISLSCVYLFLETIVHPTLFIIHELQLPLFNLQLIVEFSNVITHLSDIIDEHDQ